MTTDERLDRIEELLLQILQQKTVKNWYTTAEVAEILGKAKFTVREWMRLGRVNAERRLSRIFVSLKRQRVVIAMLRPFAQRMRRLSKRRMQPGRLLLMRVNSFEDDNDRHTPTY